MGSMSKDIKWVKVMLCLTGWILWLLEHFVKYMTKNAYIQIALTNKSFFPSAWNAFALIIKHAHRFGFGSAIGTVYIFFGCMLVGSVTTSCAYLFLTNQYELLMITSPIPATICVGIISTTISYLFMSVFSFSSDAILQSFLLDEELRFAGNSRPAEMDEFAKTLKSRGKGCCSFTCL
jgi:choline transporter-like protein 2/4/5